MNIKPHSQERRDLVLGAGISLLVHAAVVAALIISWVLNLTADNADELEKDEEPSVEVVLEDVDDEQQPQAELAMNEPWRTEPVEPEPDVVREEDEEEEEEEEAVEEPQEQEEEEEQDLAEPPDDSLLERYAVDQQTNEEEPVEADHISDQAHKVEEETVADVTTLQDVPTPEDDLEAPLDESETELEMAMRSPKEFVEPDLIDPNAFEELEAPPSQEFVKEELEEQEAQEEQEEQEEVLVQEVKEYLDPSQMIVDGGDRETERPKERENRLFELDQARMERLFEQQEQEAAQKQSPRGRRLLSRWRENEESLRASLENFLPHIQTGNHTSVNARAAAHASYIARIHRYIHANWAMRFLPSLQSTYSNAHPLNDMSLSTVVEIVIDAQTGQVLETGRVTPSGNTLFDGEALITAREIGVHPEPPASIVSPDGKIYIHWTFWRDQRQCGSFGVRIYRLQDQGQRRSIIGDELGELEGDGRP